MAGMISAGQGYGQKALSGFIRQSAQQNQIDLENARLAEQEKAQNMTMAVEGGVVGYKAAPTIASMFSSPTSLESGAGQSAMQEIAGTTMAPAGTVAGQTSGAVMGAAPEAGAAALAAPVTETAATTVGTEVATNIAANAAADTALGAGGAELGAEAGIALGPVGIIAGAGLGYLLSKLF